MSKDKFLQDKKKVLKKYPNAKTMMDNNGNWSQDYELSIEYTDNEFIVGNIWNGSMLMPRIGSEDNYCIDTIRLKFYYTSHHRHFLILLYDVFSSCLPVHCKSPFLDFYQCLQSNNKQI